MILSLRVKSKGAKEHNAIIEDSRFFFEYEALLIPTVMLKFKLDLLSVML